MTPTLSQGQAEPTDAELLESFVKHSGGPSPMYRCVRCSQTEYGLRNCLADHWKACKARLAATSAAPTADLRATFVGPLTGMTIVELEDAAAQLAAVAAPEARISLTDEQILTCLNSLSPPSGRWKGPREHNIAFARAIEAALRHPAAPGSSMPSAAPLSEPCALDQGARPVRMLTEEEMQTAYALDYDDEQFADRDPTWLDRMHAAINRFCEVNGIAPPVDQQEGSTQ